MENYTNLTEITYLDEVPDFKTREYNRYGFYAMAIDDFIKSDKPAMVFACKNRNHVNSVRTAVRSAIRNKYHNCTMYTRSNHVYMIKGYSCTTEE